MYEIRAELENQRVFFHLTGDTDHDSVQLHKDFQAAAAKVKARFGYFDALVDMAEVHVLADERADSGEALVKWCLANGMRRGAIAVGTAIQEIQLKRFSALSDQYRYFQSVEEAKAWLAVNRKAA